MLDQEFKYFRTSTKKRTNAYKKYRISLSQHILACWCLSFQCTSTLCQLKYDAIIGQAKNAAYMNDQQRRVLQSLPFEKLRIAGFVQMSPSETQRISLPLLWLLLLLNVAGLGSVLPSLPFPFPAESKRCYVVI